MSFQDTILKGVIILCGVGGGRGDAADNMFGMATVFSKISDFRIGWLRVPLDFRI
jgi:hypothetical protein